MERYQKVRSHKMLKKKSKNKQTTGHNVDRLGKLHSTAGMRQREKVEAAHQLEASLQSNRIPAMWNHPFYLNIYEDIMAMAPPPVVGPSTNDLRAIDPDEMRVLLESRLEEARASTKAFQAAEAARLLKLPQETCVGGDALTAWDCLATGREGGKVVESFAQELLRIGSAAPEHPGATSDTSGTAGADAPVPSVLLSSASDVVGSMFSNALVASSSDDESGALLSQGTP